VLLRFAPGIDTSALAVAARATGVPLRMLDIDKAEAAQRYARKLVLVRPDGHVAWRADALPADCKALLDTVRGA
jgi:hypothetical protein